MDLEIAPEPSDEERAAIAAALTEEAEERAVASATPPQDFLMLGEDSVSP